MSRHPVSSTTGQLGSASSHASSVPCSASAHGLAAAPSLQMESDSHTLNPSARLMLNRYVYETRLDCLPFSERLQQLTISMGHRDI
ncbi:hypothetical protein E4U55_004144 [Claviceps digitariae]|nr:hypothetical protein E4U55_004144 [Claviceps digitariae]